jgi:hypothetical protein
MLNLLQFFPLCRKNENSAHMELCNLLGFPIYCTLHKFYLEIIHGGFSSIYSTVADLIIVLLTDSYHHLLLPFFDFPSSLHFYPTFF